MEEYDIVNGELIPKIETIKSNLVIKDSKIIVPEGIRFISDWKDYSLGWFQFPHILDKKIPGCGFTEYCIRTYMPVILCSPRKILLENKSEQHKGEVFYFKNELETDLEMDKDLTKITKASGGKEETESEKADKENKRIDTYTRLKNELISYLRYCSDNMTKGISPKILVTYDSFRLVKEILKNEGVLNNFYIVIDEFQSIFTDSRFKSTTEMEFVEQLKGLQRVCYVSATPMIDSYLKEMPEFKDLPYYELDWETEDPNRVVKPDLKIRVVRSITSQAKEIIKTYKSGNFEKSTKRDENGIIKTIESKEAVFYVNSVSNIISIINATKLTSEECNILCSKTETNIKRIKSRLGKDFNVGKVPLKGESHKMFTFCTRTVYLGADFYSTNARTFILSDANFECLAVDISLDLPQILGRQRDLSNPWKNRAEFYYKTLGKKKETTKEAFNQFVEEKKKVTNDLMDAFKTCKDSAKQNLAKKYLEAIKYTNYKGDYIAVNKHAGKDLVPVINNLVIIAEQRAFDIQQVDYKDRFSVFNTIIKENIIEEGYKTVVSAFIDKFNSLKYFKERLKLFCEIEMNDETRGIILDQIPLSYKNYYETLGPERLKALGYDKTNIVKEYSDLQFDKTKLETEIYKKFQVGERYSKMDIKETLSTIYLSLGYNKTPKANDLEEYFEIKECKKLNEITGKRDMAFELIKKERK